MLSGDHCARTTTLEFCSVLPGYQLDPLILLALNSISGHVIQDISVFSANGSHVTFNWTVAASAAPQFTK